MKSHPSTRAAGAALALLSGLLGACGGGRPSDTEGLAEAVKLREPTRVLVDEVEQREMVRVLETTTRVESERHVELFPRVTGVVTELFAEEGERVGEGDLLARLDDRDARIRVTEAEVALEEAKANLPKLKLAVDEAASRLGGLKLSAEQAERDYERNRAIAEGGPDRMGLISQTELEAKRLARDTARSEHQTAKLTLQRAQVEEKAGGTAVRRAELTLESARLALSYTEIAAPFDGVIAERRIKIGDTVNASAATFVITDPDDLRAVFYRPQRELSLFVRGVRSLAPVSDGPANGHGSAGAPSNGSAPGGAELELGLAAEALPGLRFRGSIERIAPTIDPRSGNFRITARLDPEPLPSAAPGPLGGRGRLLPGMLVRLEIVTERRPDALVVHKRAVQREGDVSLVYVVREGRAERVPIEEGLSDDQHVQVLALGAHELRPGEAVVVVGHRDLEDGAEVAITRADDGSEEPARSAKPEEPADNEANGAPGKNGENGEIGTSETQSEELSAAAGASAQQ